MLVRTETFRKPSPAAGSPIPPTILDSEAFRPFTALSTGQPTEAAYEVPAGTDTLILMAFTRSGSGWAVTGVGWDQGADGSPQAFTSIGNAAEGITKVSAWRLHSPDIGTGELEITIAGGTGPSTTMAFVVFALDVVDTAAAIVAATSNGASSQPAQLAIDPPDPAARILHAVNVSPTGLTVSGWNGANEIDAGSYTAAAAYTSEKASPDGASTTVELDLSSAPAEWAQIAVAVKGTIP